MEPRKDYYAPMHTAEHILNQTMVQLYGCERSFSNHIERKKSKCDYKFDRSLSDEDILNINKRVNQIIGQGLSVSEQVIAFGEANVQYNLDKIPGDQPDEVRIIRIGNYDACPCIGEHVKNTCEIGEFKITTTSFENGILRIRYKLMK